MKRIYYAEPAEPFLDYQDGLLHTYAYAAQTAILPQDHWALLQHMSAFAAFVEALLLANVVADDDDDEDDGNAADEDPFAWLRDGIHSEMEEEEPATQEPQEEPVPVDEMLGVAWRWHSDLIARAAPVTGHYAKAHFLSWTSFCQLFYACAQAQPTRRTELKRWRAQDYPFYQAMARKHTIDITELPLQLYSVNDLWCSVRLLVTSSLYTEAYCPEMKQYFYALFYRYCEVMSVELGDISLVLDNPLFIASDQSAVLDAYNEHKALSIPVNERLSLSSEYVYEGQSLFYSQLYRISLSDRLQSLWEENPLVLEIALDPDTETLAREAWLATLALVFQDKLLGQFIVTDFKCTLLALHLQHGEQAQYKRRFPESSAEAGEVLLLMRPDDHVKAVAIHTTPPMELLRQYKQDARHETEMAYLTRQVTARWLASQNVPRDRVIPHFQLDQLCTLEEMDMATLRDDEQVPLLLSLMRLYYVVAGRRIYRTPHFVHAYLVWLQLLRQQGRLSLAVLPPTLQECIGLFQVI